MSGMLKTSHVGTAHQTSVVVDSSNASGQCVCMFRQLLSDQEIRTDMEEREKECKLGSSLKTQPKDIKMKTSTMKSKQWPNIENESNEDDTLKRKLN